jgi:hypothetical protein
MTVYRSPGYSRLNTLSNHPIRPRQHVRWDRQADLLGGFEIDDEVELRRLLDRNVWSFATPEKKAAFDRTA